MIDTALERAEMLVVYVNTTETDAVPGSLRQQWLADLHPEANIVEVRHQLTTDFSDELLWQQWMALFRSHWPLGDGPHAVFSSDAYVAGLAQRFGAVAETVDARRERVPISASMIRAEPSAHLELLAEPVRNWVQEQWC
jgi:HTH-type transcriptional repressor of NAD biosynthesis genes